MVIVIDDIYLCLPTGMINLTARTLPYRPIQANPPPKNPQKAGKLRLSQERTGPAKFLFLVGIHWVGETGVGTLECQLRCSLLFFIFVLVTINEVHHAGLASLFVICRGFPGRTKSFFKRLNPGFLLLEGSLFASVVDIYYIRAHDTFHKWIKY